MMNEDEGKYNVIKINFDFVNINYTIAMKIIIIIFSYNILYIDNYCSIMAILINKL